MVTGTLPAHNYRLGFEGTTSCSIDCTICGVFPLLYEAVCVTCGEFVFLVNDLSDLWCVWLDGFANKVNVILFNIASQIYICQFQFI